MALSLIRPFGINPKWRVIIKMVSGDFLQGLFCGVFCYWFVVEFYKQNWAKQECEHDWVQEQNSWGVYNTHYTCSKCGELNFG